jgi:hypothetical protein
VLISYLEDNCGNQISSLLESVKKRVRREPPFREIFRAEVEESSLLEAVTSERLVKTQQVEKTACAVVICKARK